MSASARPLTPLLVVGMLAVAACGGGTGGAGSGRGAAPPTGELADRRRAFVESCSKKDPAYAALCECTWDELRAALGDEAMRKDEADPAALERAKPRVEKACSGKVSEDVVHAAFVRGCVGDKSTHGEYCDCMWQEVRKRFSIAEVTDDATIKSPRFVEAREPMARTCEMKVESSPGRDAFMSRCARSPAYIPICSCTWNEIRRTGAAVDPKLSEKTRETEVQRAVDACKGRKR